MFIKFNTIARQSGGTLTANANVVDADGKQKPSATVNFYLPKEEKEAIAEIQALDCDTVYQVDLTPKS